MKAFVVLALVACVAARSVDVDTLRFLKKDSLLSRDELLKDKLTHHRFSFPQKSLRSVYGDDYTTPSVYGDDYVNTVDSWAQRRVTILSFEELVSTPLFRSYLRIPLFIQYLKQYPVVFRRYLESPLFQQFWTQDEFETYFRNPVLFYKYIVPQIQLIAQSTTETPYDSVYGYDSQDYPVYGRDQNQEVTVGDYLNRIWGRNTVDRRSTVFPLAYTRNTFNRYNPEYVGRQFQNGDYFNVNTNTNYKFLLDKIYKTLFLNKPVVGETTQVRTEVELTPPRKEVIVEPITGEQKVVVEQPRIVDVQVNEKIVPTTRDVETVALKEVLLKKLLINKHITPELYTVLRTLPYHQVKEIIHRIVPSVADLVDVESVYGDDVSDITYPTRFDNVDVNDILNRHRISNIFDRDVYNRETLSQRTNPEVVRALLKVLGHRNIVPTIDEIVRP
jgi:hypothetical protein